MSQPRERNIALFIDFDNVALGARDSRMRFDVRLLMQRVLEKGKVLVKRAYADWHYYKEHMTPLHEAAIELIEVPSPSGPFGAKGVGEQGVIGAPPAIGNAVRDATGVAVRRLPITAERVWSAMRDAAG